MSEKPRFKVGDIVYFKPAANFWVGKVCAVIPAEKNKRKITRYSVLFEDWGIGRRYEDELYATEDEARNAVH